MEQEVKPMTGGQFVCVNGNKSDSLSITCGILQGSILGPLMFLLRFYLCADDINIYCSNKLTITKIMN